MLKTRLKPHVHKVKGIKNYGLYDILNGNFYTLTPDGDVETLKHSLKELGLTFETAGTVPFPITLSMSKERDGIELHQVQIRLNGFREADCQERQRIDGEKRFMSMPCLTQIIQELSDIPVGTLKIEADTIEPEKIVLLLQNAPYQKAALVSQEKVSLNFETQLQEICKTLNTELVFLTPGQGERNIKELQVSAYDFFYRQSYNPCFGHQVAVDCGGEIKPCLWWAETLGFIGRDNLKKMIIAGTFNDYWEWTKDRIPVCQDCERRLACNDCRVNVIPTKGDPSVAGKPAFCDYIL